MFQWMRLIRSTAGWHFHVSYRDRSGQCFLLRVKVEGSCAASGSLLAGMEEALAGLQGMAGKQGSPRLPQMPAGWPVQSHHPRLAGRP